MITLGAAAYRQQDFMQRLGVMNRVTSICRSQMIVKPCLGFLFQNSRRNPAMNSELASSQMPSQEVRPKGPVNQLALNAG